MFKKYISFGFLFLVVIGFKGVCFACGGGYIRFDIEPIDSPKVAGIPFLITITSEEEMRTPVDLFLDDTTATIQPRKIRFMGRWEGLVTITKSGITSITVSTERMDVKSNKFSINPGPPTRFILYPNSPIIEAPRGKPISIKAKLVDDYGNPVQNKECLLSQSGQKGRLSAQNLITDLKGEVFATYTTSFKKGAVTIIEIQTKDVPEVWGISGKITTKRKD
jgi:hypothetical protein